MTEKRIPSTNQKKPLLNICIVKPQPRSMKSSVLSHHGGSRYDAFLPPNDGM
jgi:hypothetical protein